MNIVERQPSPLARNVRRLGHLDLPGAGQVTVAGRHAYVGHIPNKNHLGTSIIDIADPGNPRVVATITLDDHELAQPQGAGRWRHHDRQSRAQHERDRTARRELPAARRELDARRSGASRNHEEIAARMRVTADDCASSRSSRQRGYHNGGFKIYDVSKPAQPKLDLLSQDRRHRRASLRHGRALRLHLDRDEGLRRQHPGHLRPARSANARGSGRAGGCRGSTSRAARRRPGRAGGIACTMRCASATRCGRAAGTAASGSSTSPTWRSRRAPAATTITRCSRSRRIP